MGKTATPAALVDHKAQIIKSIQQLGQKHSTWKVFEDFLALSALSISNAVDLTKFKEREEQYLEITKKYSHDELEQFVSMLANLTLELERCDNLPKDILGVLFHDLELHNKYHGQFFTPNNICEMMGRMSVSGHDKAIEEKGYVTVCEPCCGSGAMVLGFANAMAHCVLNYQQQLLVYAMDIDIKCVYMTYIQLSLLGIPAVVIHGNSLTLEEWSRWYTPLYILGGWQFKQDRPTETVKKIRQIISTTTQSNGQLSFF